MSVLLFILGLVLLAVVSFDVLVTTLTLRGGGFLTNRFSSWLWHGATKIHRYNTNHRLLAVTGLLIVLGMAFLWYFMTWVAWSLIFTSFQDAIINSSDKEPASIWGRIYFAAYTLTTLGRGDYLPTSITWHLLTGLAAANGFFLVTLSIAYLFPIISAVIQKRSLAIYISSLGGTGDTILTNTWNGKDFGNLEQHLISLTPLILGLSEQHLAYPVLHYFHTRERSRSLALSIAALDEAMTLLKYAVVRDCCPDPASLNTARRACSALLNNLKSDYIEPDNYEPNLVPLKLLQDRGIPTVSDRAFSQATKQISKRRKLLLALVRNDGWSWEAVASSHTTNRATNLDDETMIDSVILHQKSMMEKSNNWIDISLTIYPGMPYWPDNPAVNVEPSQCLAHGDVCNVSKMTIGTHTGTHVDGINHFIKGGIGVDKMPLDATIGRARVIEIKDSRQIKVAEIEPYNIQAGERILFKTQNSDRALQTDEFLENFVHISTEAADYLAEKKVRTVGVDYLSVGGYQGNVIEVHQALLGSGIWAVEGLNLSQVAPGEYELICLPIKLKDGDGGLARAILRPIPAVLSAD